ncbi:dispanin subfamily A member 2b-like [Pelobates cultripes]|uniref:Dispanin subfamily A member 2b-like n=1 Tax=Pelobates cultripes TaxID=61616 RepID=A0AAD1TKH5_PELCU|nr:dispanin subfamily A member 2b-like [Pelobates cultripes]
MENSDYPKHAAAPIMGAPPIYENHGYAATAMPVPNIYNPAVHTTVVTISPSESSVIRDHLPWSIFNILYMNFCCLGLCAVVHSVKSRDRKLAGDRFGAVSHGTKARNFNIAATTLTLLLCFIMFILVVSGIITAVGSINSRYPSNPYNPYNPYRGPQ